MELLSDTSNGRRKCCCMKMRGWLVHKPGFVPHSGTHASTEKAPAVEAVQSNLGQAPAECWARNRNVQQFFNCDKIADMVDKGQNSLQKTTSEVATPGGRDGNTARMIHVNHRGRTHEPPRTSEQSVRGLYLWLYGLVQEGCWLVASSRRSLPIQSRLRRPSWANCTLSVSRPAPGPVSPAATSPTPEFVFLVTKGMGLDHCAQAKSMACTGLRGWRPSLFQDRLPLGIVA